MNYSEEKFKKTEACFYGHTVNLANNPLTHSEVCEKGHISSITATRLLKVAKAAGIIGGYAHPEITVETHGLSLSYGDAVRVADW